MPQLAERCTEDVFDHHEIAVRCDDDAFGGKSPMTGVRCIVVQFRHRAEQLLSEIEGGLDIEWQQVLLGHREHPREPDAGDRLGDDRQFGPLRDVLEVEHAREVVAAHMGQLVDAFSEEELERWNRREGVA